MSLSRAVEILRELIALPSVNPMGGDVVTEQCYEGRMSDWLEGFFRGLGVPCRRIEVCPGRDNIVAQWTPPRACGRLLLDAHQDTVPADGMTVPPFTATVDQGRVYGRGAVDVKGALAGMLAVFERLVDRAESGGPEVWISCSCDEEATMLGIRRLARGWESRGTLNVDGIPRPDAALVAEPTELDIVTAHRGVIRWKIRTQGRACHSSDPTHGENAIYAMADVLQWFRRESQRLREDVLPHALCGYPTVNVGTVRGGSSVNIVPDRCEVDVERRLVPGEDPLLVWETMQQACRAAGTGPLEFDQPYIICPPLADSLNSAVARHVQQAAQKSGVASRLVGVGYGTHASTLAEAGVPTVVFGPGSIEQAHTADEYIELDQLEKAIEIWWRVCTTPLGASPNGSPKAPP